MKNVPNNTEKTIEHFFAEADIHDLAREKDGGIVTAFMACIVFVVESLLVYWAINANLSPLFVLVLHGAVSVILYVYARILRDSSRENRFAYLLFLVTASTGPFGAAGVVFSLLLYFIFNRRSQHFSEWYESIFPSVNVSQPEQVYDDLLIGRDESSRTYSVIPFLDVLSYGNELQKRQALAKMTSNFNPSFAPAFKKALNSDSNTIRVQAATAISKIESSFTAKMMKLTKVNDKFPNEPVVVKALAEHFDDYAYTGLLDADREQSNRQKAYEHYLEYLELQPADVDVRTRIGRILMRNKEYEKASKWFAQCLQLGYTSDAIAAWYSEALFHCKKFDELRRYSLHLKQAHQDQSSPQQSLLRDALNLWRTAEGRA